MTTIDDSTALALGLTSFLLFVVLYVWTALGLSAVFRKSGEQAWKGWVPILNLVVLLQLGGLSGWFVLIVLVPIIGPLVLWALLIVACYRINVAFGHGAGLTVVAALLLPVWASILGFGPARWLGADTMAGPRRPGIRTAPYGGGPHRTAVVDGPESEYVPRVSPPAYSPSVPFPAAPAGGWTPPPVPPAVPGAPARPADPYAAARFEPVEFDSDLVTDYPSNPPGLPASARPPAPPIHPAPPLPPAAGAAQPQPAAAPETPAAAVPPPFPAEPSSSVVEPPPVAGPIAGRSSLEPQSARSAGEWGEFDLGAVSEVTGDVTAADSGAPAPISAVPTLPPAEEAPVVAAPLVTRLPAPPASADTGEPWAPARSTQDEPDAFPETSGQVSAIVDAPDAGTPRYARASVSAQHTKAEIPDDPIDQTIVTRRRRTAWSLIPPSGAPVPITAEVVILGRKPDLDRTFPSAQLVSIDDGTVSKTHARLELREDHWYVTDLDSTNGVLFATLMGTEVEATPGVEVEAGERFFLGDAEVRLQRSDG